MKNLVKTLALAAFALAGAFGATTAQASAANFNVYFAVHNADASASMERTGTLPGTITGLSGSSVAAGGNDPSSGHATYSNLLPGLSQTTSATLTYQKVGGGSACSFTISVKNDGNPLGAYLLHFTTDAPARCSVPSDARSATGQFTGQTYVLSWSA
ncbi:MAG TPA: hypothetical protein VGD01_17815 [Candidatus Elarobacter sp.]|jgi:hypothetical protein